MASPTLGHSSVSTTSIYPHASPGDSSGLYLPVWAMAIGTFGPTSGAVVECQAK